MGITTWQLLAATWSWDPSVLIGCVGLVVAYLVAVGFRPARRAVWYMAGVLVLWLALESSLDQLGDTYLFSAHMLQHLLLLLVVPPLLLMGIPDWLAQAILDRPLLARVERLLARPLLALFLYLATIWVWHLPALYDAAVLNEGIHILEHLLFLVTATIFWWPILAPVTACRMDPMLALFYLFAAGAANSVLGIILTFAPVDIYPIYLSPLDSLGALPLIRQQWGLTRAVDQQVGGLLMWVPGMLAYLFGAIAELARWYGTPEEDVVQISDTLSQPTVP